MHKYVNSELSTTDDEFSISSKEKYLRRFVKQMLQTRIFLGHYQEKRYVDTLQSYRDVIVLSDSESELKTDVDHVRKRLNNFFSCKCWIGMTGPEMIGTPNGHCFWVESQNITFGHYWFTIKSVKFRSKEALLQIKPIRPLNIGDNSNSTNISARIENTPVWETVKNEFIEDTIILFTQILTPRNIIQTITFLSVLLATTFTIFISSISFFMEFILKFFHELSFFVQSFTPVMIAVINLIEKVIGGFFIFITMLWRGNSAPLNPMMRTRHRAIMPERNARPIIEIK